MPTARWVLPAPTPPQNTRLAPDFAASAPKPSA